MSASRRPRNAGQRGMALVSALLLLAVVTILAVGMFRSFGVQEQIAGNLREKQRALHAAQVAQQYAEHWLSSDDNAASVPVECDSLLSANLSQGQICTNSLASVTTAPWKVNAVEVGVTYNPGGAMVIKAAPERNSYYKLPRFYIADSGLSADATGQIYTVTAQGWGGNPGAVAVVQSTYSVQAGVIDRGGP